MENITVLIVDDNKLEQEILKSDLGNSNFQCILADNGKQALGILKNEEINVVISDQRMPEMDGLELLQKVKSKYGDLPFIMLTGSGSIDKAVASIKSGATDYILKPYNL